MVRDKKDPKPLDNSAFNTLVKTAHEVVRRHEQHQQALLHKQVKVSTGYSEYVVTLVVLADDFEPYVSLAAVDASGRPVAEVKVSAGFKLNSASALR